VTHTEAMTEDQIQETATKITQRLHVYPSTQSDIADYLRGLNAKVGGFMFCWTIMDLAQLWVRDYARRKLGPPPNSPTQPF
jgi:hypothetical protein